MYKPDTKIHQLTQLFIGSIPEADLFPAKESFDLVSVSFIVNAGKGRPASDDI
jgi:hypothetical protein